MTRGEHEGKRCATVGSRHAGGNAWAGGGQCSRRRKPGSCCRCSGYQSFDDLWLAGAISTWWLGSVEGEAAVQASAETRWQEAEVDLRHGDAKEPVAAQVRICVVDA